MCVAERRSRARASNTSKGRRHIWEQFPRLALREDKSAALVTLPAVTYAERPVYEGFQFEAGDAGHFGQRVQRGFPGGHYAGKAGAVQEFCLGGGIDVGLGAGVELDGREVHFQ